MHPLVFVMRHFCVNCKLFASQTQMELLCLTEAMILYKKKRNKLETSFEIQICVHCGFLVLPVNFLLEATIGIHSD